LSSIPCAANGFANALTRQFTTFLPYGPRLVSCNGGCGDRTLILQET
jgi:hypothetical protein